MSTPPEPPAAVLARALGPVPKFTCPRCEDWHTIVIANATPPCPVCRPEQYAEWRASSGVRS